MNNSSSAGDGLDLMHDQNTPNTSRFKVSGHFDIFHTCSETGTVTDHSGPNVILQDGVTGMLRGLSSFGTATSEGRQCTRAGFLVSSVTTARTAGQQALPATYTSVNCATSTQTDRLYPNDADTEVEVSTNLASGNGGIWFASPASTAVDVFQNATSGTVPVFNMVSDAVVLKANQSGTAQDVNGIFVVNVVTASNPGTGTSTIGTTTVPTDLALLAGRTTGGSGDGQMNSGNAIQMNNNDTLSITYTLSITAS